MAVLYICVFSGDLPVIPCSDENIGHFERRNAYPFKFTCNSTGCSGVVVDCGSSHTFRRQSNFFIYGSGVRVVVSDTTNLIDGITGGLQTVGIGRLLDYLEERLPERLLPLLEKARELLPNPEIGRQQEQQQHQRGMGGMEL